MPGEGEHKSKTFTRRSVLAMAGCGVAGLVVGGVLASWGVTSKSIASGRIEIRTTPTKMIVTDRARFYIGLVDVILAIRAQQTTADAVVA